MKIASEWASEKLLSASRDEVISNATEKPEKIVAVRQLRDVCQRYEYAEAGQGEDLLVTEPLKNLATTFRDDLPRVVSIGAKGAGKTFNYIQLSRFQYWERFLNHIDNTQNKSEIKTHIFPLLQSGKLGEQAKDVINQARNAVIKVLGDDIPDFLASEYEDRIKIAISRENWNEPEWTKFWINEIARSIGMNPDETDFNISSINHKLRDKALRLIFLFDGLEDIFPDIASNKMEQTALRALIEGLPKKLSEIRQAHLGVIIFLRRDFLRHAITQNLKQFENLYRSFDLSWDQDSFLRLVFWICRQAKILEEDNGDKAEIESLTRENLKQQLEKLWGKKLGTKEAYTDSWVFAALTDFTGRLQARDIVRFLYHTADITINRPTEVQFEKWSTDRLLPPKAIRGALKPCSEKKVEEAKEEYPAFKTWVEDTLPKSAERKIPFAVEEFGMDQSTLTMLEAMGVIYEDKEKEDAERFYMPEIFREGLGFSLRQKSRPRVLVLKRKALGRGII
jgi:hypothetical protein